MKIFRWRAIGAVLFILLLLGTWWFIFGERTVQHSLEDAATSMLGTQVDIHRLEINEARTTVTLNGIAIADPFDRMKNLLEATGARIELELEPLLRKKVVVRNMSISGIRTGTDRETPARPVDTSGFAPRAITELRRFRERIDVPLLSLTPIDTIKALVLDPTQLKTVQSALALQDQADSMRTTITQRAEALVKTDIVDSAEALLTKLRGQNARSLGVVGALRAVQDVRRMVSRVDSVKRGVESLRSDVTSGYDSLIAATRAVNDARRADYAFARGLLQLPTFDAPSIGPALFGDVSISSFEKATYWVELAKEHAPPGLVPRERPGPKRLRRPGRNVSFVTRATLPDFLMREGDIAISLGEETGIARGDYSLSVTNLTSAPSILGQPTRFALRRASAASDVRSIDVEGVLDHTTERIHDVINLRASGLKLPELPLPGIPLRLDPGRGATALSLEMLGDSISARWSLSSSEPVWQGDSAQAGSLSTLESLLVRVLRGIQQLSVEAELTGTLASPNLSVRSNLDREVANSIRSVVGEEIQAAEQKVRAQVDSIAEEKLAPVRARIAEIREQALARVQSVSAEVDSLRTRLADQLRAIGG